MKPKFKVGDEVIVLADHYVVDDGAIGFVTSFYSWADRNVLEVNFGYPFGEISVWEDEVEFLSVVKSPLYKALS